MSADDVEGWEDRVHTYWLNLRSVEQHGTMEIQCHWYTPKGVNREVPGVSAHAAEHSKIREIERA